MVYLAVEAIWFMTATHLVKIKHLKTSCREKTFKYCFIITLVYFALWCLMVLTVFKDRFVLNWDLVVAYYFILLVQGLTYMAYKKRYVKLFSS